MKTDYVSGTRINTILGKNIFKNENVHNDDVKDATGLSIQDLIMAWIFSSRNNFKKALSEWKNNNKLMDYEYIKRADLS